MMIKRGKSLILAVLVAMLLPAYATAQAGGGGGDIGVTFPPPVSPPVDPGTPTPQVVPQAFYPVLPPGQEPVFIPRDLSQRPGPAVSVGPDPLSSAAAALEQAALFCQAVPREYRVDCIAERIGAVADALPNTPETAEVKAVLEKASREIEAVVRSARDTSKPPIRARAPAPAPVQTTPPIIPLETTRPIVPVKPEQQAAVEAQAADIIEEAQTTLLRSAEGSAERAVAYLEIVEALDSNKVLLRS